MEKKIAWMLMLLFASSALAQFQYPSLPPTVVWGCVYEKGVSYQGNPECPEGEGVEGASVSVRNLNTSAEESTTTAWTGGWNAGINVGEGQHLLISVSYADVSDQMEVTVGSIPESMIIGVGGIWLDTRPPEISVRSSQGEKTYSPTTTLLITVFDGSLEYVEVNGERVLEWGGGTYNGTISKDYPLQLGSNNFVVAAEDSYGRRTVRELHVEREAPTERGCIHDFMVSDVIIPQEVLVGHPFDVMVLVRSTATCPDPFNYTVILNFDLNPFISSVTLSQGEDGSATFTIVPDREGRHSISVKGVGKTLMAFQCTSAGYAFLERALNGTRVKLNLSGPVSEIEFDVLRDLHNASVRVAEVNLPPEIPRSPKLVYAYFTITPHNFSWEDVGNISLVFNVTGEWINSSNADEESVTLSKYADRNWIIIPTKKIGPLKYASTISSFSLFAIVAGEKQKTIPPPQIIPITTTITSVAAILPPPLNKPPILMMLIAVIVASILTLYLLRR